MSTLSEDSQDNLGWVYPLPPQTEITTTEAFIGVISGMTPLTEDQDYVDVVFGEDQPTEDWVLLESGVLNTTDVTPINLWVGTITEKTVSGFRVYLNGLPDSENYFLSWSIRGAFGYYFSGPSSGTTGVASTFTVRLPDESTITGTVIITPDDGGAGGIFAPTTVELTLEEPSAEFTYTASSYGARSISVTNDRGLVNPAQIGYSIATPTYGFSGPSSGESGVESTDFTVTLSGAVFGTLIVTPSDGGGGGTFTPTSVALTTLAPSDTFTYTPASGGVKTISVTNSGGLANPASLPYTSIGVVLLNTLISYWKLDEASGTRNDAHGSNHLTESAGTISGVAAKINNGLSCGGSGCVHIASNSTLQVTSDFTFSLWVKLNVQTGQFLLEKQDVGVLDYNLQYTAAEGFAWQLATASAASDYAKGAITSNGVWTHLVCWYDSGTGQCYMRVNDTTTYASTTCPALVQTSAGFAIGASFGGAIPANAVFDEVGFWKRVLNDVEITQLYNAGSGWPYSSFTA